MSYRPRFPARVPRAILILTLLSGLLYAVTPGGPASAAPPRKAFKPAHIGGLRVWLNADSLKATDGAPVGSWTDRSGGRHHALQATAESKPTFRANALNGRPVLEFDGVDDHLAIPDFDYGRTELSVFVVATADPGMPYGAVVNHVADHETGFGWELVMLNFNAQPDTPMAFVALSADGSLTETTSKMHFGSTMLANVPRLMAFTWSPSRLDLRVDLTPEVEFPLWDGSVPQIYDVPGPLAVGALPDPTGPWAFWDGDIAEVLIYDRALTATEEAQVDQYLVSKYGLGVI